MKFQNRLFNYTTLTLLVIIFVLCGYKINQVERLKEYLLSSRFSNPNQQDTTDKIKDITNCFNKPMELKIDQQDTTWTIYNYITAHKSFNCGESITYVTHSDFTFLDNLVPLVERWQGPISIALFTPGDDFFPTLQSISYLRDCETDLIRKFVTFHINFPSNHIPKSTEPFVRYKETAYNCSLSAPYQNDNHNNLYRHKHNLTYPINALRNIAKEASQTYFVLVSDIELYPSVGIIPRFLKMITESEKLIVDKLVAFPITPIEIKANKTIPSNKAELRKMLRDGTAIPFHQGLCSHCHRIPDFEEWKNLHETPDFHVFRTIKRLEPFAFWEPFYIGTKNDPYYDERFTWEGMKDKHAQAYIMCVMKYDFSVIDHAFLVHKSGIKTSNSLATKYVTRMKQLNLINQVIYPQMVQIFGYHKGCTI